MLRRKKSTIVPCLILFFVVFTWLTVLSMAAGTGEIPATPVGKRVKELVDLFNRVDRQAFLAYAKANFSDSFLKLVPIENHLAIFNETCDKFGRLEFEYVYEEESKDFSLSVKLHAPETDTWIKMIVQVTESPPHKITGIQSGMSWPPKGSAPSDRKLTEKDMVDILSRYVEKLAKAGRFSGTVLLAKGDKILFKGAYGLASIRYQVPNKIDTKFNLGSMNKMFTSVAVAQLAEKGKLSYNDLVGKYLDSTWVQPETAKKVKIEHLLTHTSGLGSFFNKKFVESSRLLYRDIDDWKPLINDDKPKFEPGSKWSYSNSGMFLLGPIIEKASGSGYYDYIKKNLYDVAGMINSGCFDNDRPVPNLAIGYEKIYTDSGFYWRNNIFDHSVKGGPAGGGFSTVEDLHRFARALMEGKLVSKETMELMTTPKPAVNSPRYGYGFGIREISGVVSVGHSGGFTGINSVLQIFKKSGYIYAIMSNHSRGVELVQLKLDTMFFPRPR